MAREGVRPKGAYRSHALCPYSQSSLRFSYVLSSTFYVFTPYGFPPMSATPSSTLSLSHDWRAILRSLLALFLTLAQRAGNLLRTTTAPYHLATDCGGPPAPCTCSWPTGLASTYTVSGFGSVSACPSCDASSDPAWSGTLYHVGAGCVWWAADASFDPLSINGRKLDITYTQIVLRTTDPCRWELYITCTGVADPTAVMWYGYKTTGTTPAGTYTFVGSDCGVTGPGTMSVA